MALTRSRKAAVVSEPEPEVEVVDSESQESQQEEEEVQSAPIEHDSEVEEVHVHESEDESESDSDDAPEEESTSASKAAIIEKQKLEKARQAKLKQNEKEKRKQQDLKFTKQQEEKKARLEEQAAAEQLKKDQELPEFLPEGIVESLKEDSPVAKHLKVKELDAAGAKLLRQRLKEEKLRKIKSSKQTSIMKGPIHVQVQSFNINKKVVPRAEVSVVGSKNEWLKRSSLNKK